MHIYVIFLNNISDEDLVYKTYKLPNSKAHLHLCRWAKDLKRHFSKDVQMTPKHMTPKLNTVVTSEMQVKTRMTDYFILTGIVVSFHEGQ